MTISGEDMRYQLNHVRVVISELNQLSEEQNNHTVKSFAEILCMDSRDLAVGFRYTTKIQQQATRNHARLLATIILMTIRDKGSGFTSAESATISWPELKHDHVWKKYGIKRGNQTIPRLDWFLHRLMIYEGTSIVQWLRSPDEWTIIVYDDNDHKSDLEYDPQEKQTTMTTHTMNNKRKHKHQKQCNLL